MGVSSSLLMCYSEHILKLKSSLMEVNSFAILDLFGSRSVYVVFTGCHPFKGCALSPSLLFHYCLLFTDEETRT